VRGARGLRDEFTAFHALAYPQLAAQTVAITGDAEVTREAAVATLARVWRSWSSLRNTADVLVRVRWTAVLIAAERESTTPVRSQQASDAVEELTGAAVVADTVVVAALQRLPRVQRRALVLHYMGGVSVRHLSALSGSSAEHIELLLDDGFRALAGSLEWSEPHDLDGPDLSFDWLAEALADTAARLPEHIPAPPPTALLRNAAVVRWSVRAIPVAGVAACAALMAAVVQPEPSEVQVSAIYAQHGGAADGSAPVYAVPSDLTPEPAADAGPPPNPAVRMRSIALTSLLDTDEAARRADTRGPTVRRAPQTSDANAAQAQRPVEPANTAAASDPANTAAPADPARADAPTDPARADAPTESGGNGAPTESPDAAAPAKPVYAVAPTQPPSATAPAGPAPATAPAQPAAAAPAQPVRATAPTQPAYAAAPAEPAAAAAPTEPASAAVPTEPASAAIPTEPASAAIPTEPASAAVPAEPASAAGPTEPVRVAAAVEPASAAAPASAAGPTEPVRVAAAVAPASAAAPGAGAAKAAPADLAARSNPTAGAGAPAALPRLQAAAVGGATRKPATAPPQDDALALPTDPSSGPAQRAIQPGGVAAAMVAPHSTGGSSSEPQSTDARTELSATDEKARREPTARPAPSTSHERSDKRSDNHSDNHGNDDARGDAGGHGEVPDR
jgi:DNA-directed RNA polymerase specialized sigma24 family protein